MEIETGVYLIHCTLSGKNYVGSAAISLKARIDNHVSCLRGGYHGNSHLQRAWNRYGEASFEFYVLEICQPSECIEKEQRWIDHYNAADRDFGYNLSPTAGSTLGVKHSPETIEKYKAAVAKRRGELAERMMGNNLEVLNTGRPCSDEKKEAIRQKLTGRKLSEEHKNKLKKTPEQIEMLRQRALGKKQSAETVAKRVAKLRGMRRGPEALANLRAGAAKRTAKKSGG